VEAEIFRYEFREDLEHGLRDSSGIVVRFHTSHDHSHDSFEGYGPLLGLGQFESVLRSGGVSEEPVEHFVHADPQLFGQLLQPPPEFIRLGHAVAFHWAREYGVNDARSHGGWVDARGRDCRSLADTRAPVLVDGDREYSVFIVRICENIRCCWTRDEQLTVFRMTI
jgi:hypothetical protein